MTFDEISKNVIRKFQWPSGEDCRYVGKPSIYRMAKDFGVHPKVVKSRLTELYESGLIRGVRFYADDKFMPWKRYFILVSKVRDAPAVIRNHFQEFTFVERVIFGTLYVPDSVDPLNALAKEREFSSISVIAPNEAGMKEMVKLIERAFKGTLNISDIMEDSSQKDKLLNKVDLTITNEIMNQDPLKMSINVMAQKLAIPSRTLRRRVERLLDRKVIYEEVSLDTSKSQGVLITSVIMKGDFDKWLPLISKSQFLKDRLLLYKNFARFSFFIFCTETLSAIDDLTVEVTEIDPGALVTYRNGSYNNPYVRYPVQDDSEPEMIG